MIFDRNNRMTKNYNNNMITGEAKKRQFGTLKNCYQV